MEIIGATNKMRMLFCKYMLRVCQPEAPFEINFRKDLNPNIFLNLAIDGENHLMRNP
jgi:hypothetical protein